MLKKLVLMEGVGLEDIIKIFMLDKFQDLFHDNLMKCMHY